MSDILGA